MRFFKLPAFLLFSIWVIYSCESVPSDCDTAIWTSFIRKNDTLLIPKKLYRIPATPFELSFNARINRGLKEDHTLRENRVIAYIDSSSDSIHIDYDGVVSDHFTQKETYNYWIDSTYYEFDSSYVEEKLHIDTTVHVVSVERTYNKISFDYRDDSTNMYRYTVFGAYTAGCTMNTTDLSNEINLTIIPDDSIHTIIEVYATIEEGYGHVNDPSVRIPINFLIDDRR